MKLPKFNRRKLLLAGLGIGSLSHLSVGEWRRRTRQQELQALEAIARSQLDTASLLNEAFRTDLNSLDSLRTIRQSINLTPPQIPYRRDQSMLLIQANKLATQQYQRGKLDPDYDGAVTDLPAYAGLFEGYTQLASFRGTETVKQRVPVNLSDEAIPTDMQERVAGRMERVEDALEEMVSLRRDVSVFYGFLLASETQSLLVFRGTQQVSDWLANLTVIQEPFPDPSLDDEDGDDAEDEREDAAETETTPPYGLVHSGFWGYYQQMHDPHPREVMAELDPSLPCLVSGHSLGGAIATLAAFDLALRYPALRPQLQLYTYASPRVGDATFANTHSQLLPNSYRVVNLADPIPLVPPSDLNGIYTHLGQEWAFLSQNGDALPNHLIETYRRAIAQSAETQTPTSYPNLSIL